MRPLTARTVRAGWAMSFGKYSHAYDADEAMARRARAGLWAGAFIAPWEWRARNGKTPVLGAVSVPRSAQKMLLGTESAVEASTRGCAIKGNVNRAGECIFQLPGGRFYGKANMPPGKGKRWFCSEAEADAARCRKSNA